MYRFSDVMDINGKLHNIDVENIAYIIPDINIVGLKNNKEIELMENDCKQLCFDVKAYRSSEEINKKIIKKYIKDYKELINELIGDSVNE